MQVAEPARAALGDERAAAVAVKVGKRSAFLQIGHHGTHRHAQLDVRRRFPVLVGAAPVFAVPGAVDAGIAVVDQRVGLAVGDRVDAAALAAIAAVGAAARNVFLPPEARHAVAAFAGAYFNDGLVDEFHALD